MGNAIYAYITHPDTAPDYNNPPTFDANMGFARPRKERVMIATREEMEKAKLPLEKRDYCAHLWIRHLRCRQENFPKIWKCSHHKHDYEECEFHDHVLRMKEYEREKRLKERAKRIAERERLEAI